jgi:6,7-dimethyl-8-ribityllumazine synthase
MAKKKRTTTATAKTTKTAGGKPRATPASAAPRILIVEARYYQHIADALLTGATSVLDQAGASHERITVPGALEIPAAIAMAVDAAESSRKPFDGVVALGCVIAGETYHFEVVSNESARGLADLAIGRQLPLGNGILTVENEGQALARAGGNKGNKGEEAARAALTMLALKRNLAER